MSKRLGDRRDGKRLRMGGFERFLYYLKPRRSDSEVYISKCIDVTELVKYMKEKKKDNEDLTYFHLFSTAVAKVVYNKPLLNRFIIGGNKYDRNDITLSFVAKTDFSDTAREFLTVIKVDANDSLMDISRKIKGDVKKIRSNKESHTDDFVNKLGRLPKWVMAIIVWIIKRLDNHDMLPQSLTKNSVYHSTVLLVVFIVMGYIII